MQVDGDEVLSVVAMELGASWPAWLTDNRRDAAGSLVELQDAGESPRDFASRVTRRLTLLARRPSFPRNFAAPMPRVMLCVLATNGESHEESIAARQSLSRAMLRVMLDAGRGELVLCAEAADQPRHELLALAGTLCDELRGTELGVSVRFSERRPASGTLRAVRSSVPDLADPDSASNDG